MNAAVRTEGLHKFYGTAPAVEGLDLEVAAGITFGFIGPNGAGKSTTIGMLSTVIRPTAGRAEVAGYDVIREPNEVRRRISIVFQESTLDPDLTARENLRFQADLFGLPGRSARAAIGRMLNLVQLSDRSEIPVQRFSGGMRRRLEIARGLLLTPQVLFLDEPTTGLDPQTRAAIWEYLDHLRSEENLTIFLTTHQLDEAEHCDRIAIIDGGSLVADGAVSELKAVIGADLVTLRTADDSRAVLTISSRFGVDAEATADGIRFRVADAACVVPRICADLDPPVYSVKVAPPTLDDVFIHHTGRTIRDKGLGPMTTTDLGKD